MPKIKPKEYDTTDYTNLIVLCELDYKDRNRIGYYTKLPEDDSSHLFKIKTPRGYAVEKTEVERVLNTHRQGNKTTKMGYKIDLSAPSRMNCLYRRIASMSKENREYCEVRPGITRYVAQDGYQYVNVKDMCKAQIKLLAKRLECKEHEIVASIFDIMHKKYLEEKGEVEENDSE